MQTPSVDNYLKKTGGFLYRQLSQIKSAGPRVLFNKIKRAAWLFYMSMAAPFAVYFKMDWPQAYAFLAIRTSKRLKIFQHHTRGRELEINKLLDQLILYLEKGTLQTPSLAGFHEWLRNRILLGELVCWRKYDVKQSLAIFQSTAEVQRQIINGYQLEGLDMVFISPTIAQGSIGLYEHLECHIKSKMLRGYPDKKAVLLLPPQARVTNSCFLGYWNKYVTLVSDPAAIEMLAPLEGCLTLPLAQFVHYKGKLYLSQFALGEIREQWFKENRPPLLALSEQDKRKGRDVLRAWGLPSDAWFVVLHVREGGWKDEGSDQDDFRNADIENYFPAIKLITDAGGWVIRIGDATMRKLPDMTRVIDYPHTKDKSEWMDIFLCSQCRFMVGTSSGMCVVAMSFGVPLVMTDLLPACAAYEFTRQDLFILRPCFLKDKNRYLSFQELISPPVGIAVSLKRYKDLGIDIKANTAQEIKDVVGEMLERFNGGVRYDQEDQGLQENFRAVTAEAGKSYVDDADLIVYARMGRNFLRQYSSSMVSSESGSPLTAKG